MEDENNVVMSRYAFDRIVPNLEAKLFKHI